MTRRLPPGSVPSPSALVASSLAGSDEITADGHGLETGDAVSVRAVDGGTLSTPLIAGTTYYAIRMSNASFKLSVTPTGSALDLTSDGSEIVFIREPYFDDFIEEYSRWADGLLPGHLVPLQSPIHPTVKGVVADCVAKRVLNVGGQESNTLAATELAAKAILERFAAGLPLRGAPAPLPANLAVVSSASNTADSRGWGSGSLP